MTKKPRLSQRIGYHPERLKLSSRKIQHKDWFSTCVADTTYDPESEQLTIEFMQRGTYVYYNFPVETFAEFNNAGSRGKYFNLYIRDGYSYERLSI